MRTATMLGDVVADPYAALASRYGMRGLIGMLQQACREGIDAVPDAPAELRAFIESMEAAPGWLDMQLVEEGARASRVAAAFLSPFLTRGAFLATFLNTYAALPMTLTGALSGRRAARRVNETSNFFAVTTLPGALERFGEGFEAAAMVRLMHSMVRYYALQRTEQWDADVYGVPVPQVDQMPAGLINIYLLTMLAARRGRTEFNARERAILEFSRYRCSCSACPRSYSPPPPRASARSSTPAPPSCATISTTPPAANWSGPPWPPTCAPAPPATTAPPTPSKRAGAESSSSPSAAATAKPPPP
ncbi:oxygenase MpaB family protein [Nocardia sp. NPDC059229]|uniref:oxygenase MpaB family protein n=1 Tax=Nocardia sp. NPDC059229 TaxID=3346778 RepID=UPI003694924F